MLNKQKTIAAIKRLLQVLNASAIFNLDFNPFTLTFETNKTIISRALGDEVIVDDFLPEAWRRTTVFHMLDFIVDQADPALIQRMDLYINSLLLHKIHFQMTSSHLKVDLLTIGGDKMIIDIPFTL